MCLEEMLKEGIKRELSRSRRRRERIYFYRNQRARNYRLVISVDFANYEQQRVAVDALAFDIYLLSVSSVWKNFLRFRVLYSFHRDGSISS